MGVVELDFKRRIPNSLCQSIKIFKFKAHQQGLETLYQNCCICNWERGTIHLDTLDPSTYDFENIVPLCANHHTEFNQFSLNESETGFIQEFLWNIGKFLGNF